MKVATTILLFALVGGFVTKAAAQPLCATAQSVESMVINADHVFVGRLQRIQDNDPQVNSSNAVVTVEERLKAPNPLVEPHPAVQTFLQGSESQLRDWQASGCQLLVASDWDCLHLSQVLPLDPENLEAMSADLELLKTPADVIRVAKAALKAAPANVKRMHTFRLAVPREKVVGTSWEDCYDTGGHMLLYVPADARLEKLAQRYVRSDNPFDRSQGVKALRFFKTEENIALARTLLTDPYKSRNSSWEGYSGPVNHFSVRHQAYDTMRVWNIAVEKPVILEEVGETSE